MRSAFIIIVLLLFGGCRPTDVEPPEITSFSYRNDGSRRIMPVAVPKLTTKIVLPVSARFSTSPLPLPEERGIAIGTTDGTLLIVGANDSLKSTTPIAADDPVFRISANKETIVTLHNSGALAATDYDGKIRWHHSNALSRADLLLTGNTVLVIADGKIQALDATTGKHHFQLATILTPVACASDGSAFYVALSWNSSSSSDSVYQISASGTIERRWGFAQLRITSNIALAGDAKDRLVFGAQGETDPSGVRRRTYILGYDLTTDVPTQVLRQELEYIPTNVSVVNDFALASGFQMSGDDYAGAIDAFLVSANEKMWQRRFTEPLATPVAVTTQHAFFTLSFASNADIPSTALFYALDLPNGTTAREVGVTDARNGFVPGLPMPYKGALLLADASTNSIYKLIAE
jgi:hypothetical protein